MPKISVPQKNLIITAEAGENLMDVLMKAGLPVASSCLGEGICSKCAVQMQPIGQQNELEARTLQKNKLDLSYRLSCQVFIEKNDLTVQTSYW